MTPQLARTLHAGAILCGMSVQSRDEFRGPSPKINPIVASDCSIFASLVEGHGIFKPYQLSSEQLATDLADAILKGDQLFGAKIGGQVAGFIWFLEQGTFYHSGYIRLIVVSSLFAGGGVGTKLMDAAEAKVFAKTSNLFLLVSVDNLHAQSFYEKRSYMRVGELHDFVGPGLHEFVYRKHNKERQD
jgi:ribosomal protein S18 acetylase RimI-like enzyme